MLAGMPVIVVGADTGLGAAAIEALIPRPGDVRAFVTDPIHGAQLKERGVKVAVGDVSDGSHVGGAALGAFCAVLVPHCGFDDRERSFAEDPEALVEAWTEAIAEAAVQRVIWLEHPLLAAPAERFPSPTEFAVVPTVDRPAADVAADVARLDDAAAI